MIVKHRLCLSNRATVAQNQENQENQYLQYYAGLTGNLMAVPFVPSLFVEIRKRKGQSVFDNFQSATIDIIEEAKTRNKAKVKKQPKDDDSDPQASSGGTGEKDQGRQEKLILDATVAPQAVR